MRLETYIIAEIGSNHDGDLERAKKLIRLAKKAGANAVKFQSFKASTLLNPLMRKGERNPSYALLEKLSLPLTWLKDLVKVASSESIDFLSTPFDLESLKVLLSFDMPFIKIASGDLTFFPLLKEAAKAKKPLLLSLGGATLEEVKASVTFLKEEKASDIVLLHCLSAYPALEEEMNLRVLPSLARSFNLPVGLSDHTKGLLCSLAAVSLDAKVIEKHFTDDPTREGPDHSFALDFENFSELVTAIRRLEKALGDGIKRPMPSEMSERIDARRALYASQNIAQGEVLNEKNVKWVRPAYSEGIFPTEYKTVYGRKVAHDIAINGLITLKDLE